MKYKNWILIGLLTLTAACSKMVKEEPYLQANTSQPLSSDKQKDMPNTNNALSIPEVNQVHDGIPNDRPPEMAFAKKRSQNEDVVINELNGRPTIELYNDISPWELMIADLGNNWKLQSEDPENCEVSLTYNDPIAGELAEKGFLKRFFGTRSQYKDKSGDYKLSCIVENNRNLITVSKIDGSSASPHVVDDLFAHLFAKATE
ncbi:hypothetical protein [Marinicella rhabdoformis]|uniref:hypothetical protein n=1 Tax=Marinicella rhabdoformis TaxID=2580566 RepID=UPI0012AEC46B|nr:hypothetical protein [Marinicella rhabdoformis]